MVLDVIEVRSIDPGLRATLVEGHLPVADLDDPGRVFFRIGMDSSFIGYAGLEVYGHDALLRSVVVPAALHGRGHGRDVVDAALREAKLRGVAQIWLFTTSAVDFFKHLGFAVVPRHRAPVSILGTRQATKTCATASMLTRAIAP